jgi:hypothetical protein
MLSPGGPQDATFRTGRRRLLPEIGTAGSRRAGVASAAWSRPASPTREHAMGDKSPHQTTSKKPPVKSIKEKRLEKKAKTEHTSQMDNLTHGKKH